jgi:transcriptional regulator with XRE-family HTH domain
VELPHLRGLRRRAVLSQEQLAERSGVARDTISKLETGRRKAYPTTIHKLATGLEVEPRMLLGGVQYAESDTELESATEPVEESHGKPEGDRKIGF